MRRSVLKVDGILHVGFMSEGPWKKSCLRNKNLILSHKEIGEEGRERSLGLSY